MMPAFLDTIAAQATPPGFGGVGIIRVSGKLVSHISNAIIGKIPAPRVAEYHSFLDENKQIIDMGIALFFPGPNSFTGEDVLELHGHGGPVVQDILLKRVLSLGARIAEPGEFSQRAFLNDKMDLTQAEAIADLISCTSEQAAKSAIRSLQGDFSRKIHSLTDKLLHLRMYVEAAIDFPEEEIDFLSDGVVANELNAIENELNNVLSRAKQGTLLQEGITIVIAGKPNAGKSSLLNQLSGRDSAIVTDIPGTTRDILKEYIAIQGVPIHIIDTAGLRESADIVELEGIKRAKSQIEMADRIFLVIDGMQIRERDPVKILAEFNEKIDNHKLSIIINKIDETSEKSEIIQGKDNIPLIKISAKTGEGLALLEQHILECAGFEAFREGIFIARRRHLDALNRAKELFLMAKSQFLQHAAGELLGEDLKQIQQTLGEITGQVSSDELLGMIFSSFCIGK